MTSEFSRKLVSSRLPLKESSIIRRQDSWRGFLVSLQADTTSRAGVRPEPFDGVWQPFMKGKRPEA